MTSLVSDFIINPVLRQARRFSRSSATTADSDTEDKPAAKSPLARESLLSEALARNVGDHSPPFSSPDGPTREPLLDAISPMQRHRETQPATSPSLRTYDPPGSAILSSSPPASAIVDHDQLEGLTPPRSPAHNRSRSLPEDDGMGPLRKKILAVQSLEIPCEEKALLMHKLLTEGYLRTHKGAAASTGLDSRHKSGPASWEQEETTGAFDAFKFWQSTFGDVVVPQKFVLTADDVKPTFCTRADSEYPWAIETEFEETERPLGCAHYRRNVKLQCSTCNHWYTCRFCHDATEQHMLIRKETKNMLCMLCGCAQKAAEVCISCGEPAATYYCSVCKLWDSDRPTYHCAGCGICRRGLGLGKDFFHCNTCGICKPMSVAESHKCIERVTDCDCPICGEYMFTSRKRVIYIDACAHSIHEDCYTEHLKTSYRCPICYKSAINMETHFLNLDLEIQQQPMPTEFQDTKAVILCNDCCAKTTVKYHWLGLKCAVCSSYNSVELQIIGRSPHEVPGRETGTTRRPTLSWVDPPVRPRSSGGSCAIEIGNNSLTPQGIPSRFARSVSPTMIGFAENADVDAEETEQLEDDLGFWGGDEPRSTGSPEAPGSISFSDNEIDESASEDDDGEDEEEDDNDDDDDEDDEILLFGHR